MVRFLGSAVVLVVSDVQASADYFRDAIGFSYDTLWGDPPEFGILKRDGYTLMLSVREGDGQSRANQEIWDAYFWVDDAMKLYEEFQNREVQFDYVPTRQPHGCLEFAIKTPDGHSIAFGQDLE